MPDELSVSKPLILPRVGAAIVGAAILFPPLRLPLALGCLITLANAATWRRRPMRDVVPETPARPRRSGARRNGKETAEHSTEDSFPASDPPSWTPVTGTGTRH